MRTVTRMTIGAKSIIPKQNVQKEAAAHGLLLGLLNEDRLVAPPNNPILTAPQIRDAYAKLVGLAQASKRNLPTDPEDALIRDAARETLLSLTAGSVRKHRAPTSPPTAQEFALSLTTDTDLALRERACRHALSILAQIPDEAADEKETDLVDLLIDRDAGVFGLLFQGGLTFTMRLRHRNRETLRESTERFVNIVAPRPASGLKEVVEKVADLDRVSGRFDVVYSPILMKTPTGEVAQRGIVHPVSSQLRLLWLLGTEAPQSLLLIVTGLLILLDLALELHLIPTTYIRSLDMRAWFAAILSRLGTGAFGAYLVAVFLRYAEIRKKLRTTSGGVRKRFRRAAFGAFIEWRTD